VILAAILVAKALPARRRQGPLETEDPLQARQAISSTCLLPDPVVLSRKISPEAHPLLSKGGSP
jgi:hypothetical protein